MSLQRGDVVRLDPVLFPEISALTGKIHDSAGSSLPDHIMVEFSFGRAMVKISSLVFVSRATQEDVVRPGVIVETRRGQRYLIDKNNQPHWARERTIAKVYALGDVIAEFEQ